MKQKFQWWIWRSWFNLFLAKIKLKKNEISKRNGRFHPPKCRGKVQKTREETLKELFSNFFIHAAHLFGLMKSTLAGWLQHMPRLPKLLLKFSNTHNF
jgi:hypothetical protein